MKKTKKNVKRSAKNITMKTGKNFWGTEGKGEVTMRTGKKIL